MKSSRPVTRGCPETAPISQGALKPRSASDRASASSINGLLARSPAWVAISAISPLQQIAAKTPDTVSSSGVRLPSLIVTWIARRPAVTPAGATNPAQARWTPVETTVRSANIDETAQTIQTGYDA
jgi:hypothetical protein